MWIIVGLGNPGPNYAKNRHNIGHHVVDELAAEMGVSLARHRAGAWVGDGRLGTLPGGAPGPRAIIAKLGCYMNVSGPPTSAVLKYFDASAANLLVVHDELDLPPHTLRLKTGGGEGGHNGLKSISQALGTRDYHRLRVGIGRPPGRMDVADFVLSNFPASDATDWAVTVGRAADTVAEVVSAGFETAQRNLHTAD